MKPSVAILVGLFAVTASAQNNTSDPEARRRELFRTYGYCFSQQRSIDQVKKQFPDLGFQVLQVEAAFKITFGKSCEAITNMFSDNVRAGLNKQLEAASPTYVITETIARDFLNKIQNRAKGDIESPVKETLLTFNPDFVNNPSLEFTRGFTKKYSTLDHPKAQGLHLEIKVPMSWMSREGNRPHIVQFFEGEYGRDGVTMTILVQKVDPPKGARVTQKEIDSLFTASGMKDFMPDGAKVLESKPVVLEGEKGGMLVYEISADRLDFSMIVRTMQYMTFYKNRIISLQFSTGGTPENRKEWVAQFEKNRPLFFLIANSLIIMDKYKD